MVRDKNNDGEGEGKGLKGQMEVNWAGGIDNHGEIANRHSEAEFGNAGGEVYRDNWGVRLLMLGIQVSQLAPQVI